MSISGIQYLSVQQTAASGQIEEEGRVSHVLLKLLNLGPTRTPSPPNSVRISVDSSELLLFTTIYYLRQSTQSAPSYSPLQLYHTRSLTENFSVILQSALISFEKLRNVCRVPCSIVPLSRGIIWPSPSTFKSIDPSSCCTHPVELSGLSAK